LPAGCATDDNIRSGAPAPTSTTAGVRDRSGAAASSSSPTATTVFSEGRAALGRRPQVRRKLWTCLRTRRRRWATGRPLEAAARRPRRRPPEVMPCRCRTRAAGRQPTRAQGTRTAATAARVQGQRRHPLALARPSAAQGAGLPA
jgi:hypothetical protein